MIWVRIVMAGALLGLLSFALRDMPPSAWAIGSGAQTAFESHARPLTAGEMDEIEIYLRQIFSNPDIRLRAVPPEAEVHLGEHFLGVVYPQDQQDGRTFYFEMAIFVEELGRSPPVKRRR